MPVGLHEDAIDVVDVDGFVGAADGFDQATDAEVAGLAQDAVGASDDEIDGGLGEGIVPESDAIEFAEEEVAHGVGAEAFIRLPNSQRNKHPLIERQFGNPDAKMRSDCGEGQVVAG